MVREAVRDRYVGQQDDRIKAMQAFVGSRKAASGKSDAVGIVRDLRRGERIDRFHAK